MATQTPTTRAPERAATAVPPTRRRRLWTIAVIAFVIIAAGVGIWFLIADDGAPTVAFDGETATYDGPTTFDAGTVTFTFDSSEYEPGVAFVIGEITDDSITFSDLDAYSEVANSGSTRPEYLGGTQIAFAIEGDRIVEKEINLVAGERYAVFVNTAPEDTDRAHAAALLEVN